MSDLLTSGHVEYLRRLLRGFEDGNGNSIDGWIDQLCDQALLPLSPAREGWVSLPTEPTLLMIDVALAACRALPENPVKDAREYHAAEVIYKAMLSAAPEQQQQAQQQEEGHSVSALSGGPDRASGDSGTQELITEIDALAEQATPAPWKAIEPPHTDGSGQLRGPPEEGGHSICLVPFTVTAVQDIRLMAALRNAWPRLSEALKRAHE